MPDPETDLQRIFRHPLRAQILRRSVEPASQTEIATALGVARGNLGHHVRTLVGAGMLELVRVEPHRGMLKHYYQRTAKGTELLTRHDNLR